MAGRQQHSWHYGAAWSSAGYAPVDALKSEQPSPKAPQQSRKQEFRPWVHRTIPLVLLAAVSLALIGVIEYGLHILPQASLNLGSGLAEPIQPVHKRAAAPSSASSSTSTPSTSTTPSATTSTPTTQNSTPITFTPSPIATPEVGDGGGSGGSDGSGPSGDTDPGNGGASQSFTPVPTVEPSTTDGAYLPTQATTIVIPNSPVAPGTTTADPQPAQQPTSVPQGTDPEPTSNGATNQPTAGTGPGTIVPANGSPTTSPSGQSNPTGTKPTVSNPTNSHLTSSPSLSPSSSAAPASAPGSAPNDNEATLLSNVPLSLIQDQGIFFLGVYAPVVIAILIRLAAHHLYRSTKLVDPFAVLSQPGGAAFEDFFWSEHLGHESILAPFFAFRSRRWVMLWALVLYYATQLLTPFGSELTASFPSQYKYQTADDTIYVQGSALWIAVPIARILQGLLAFMFLQIVNIWILLRSYRSGLRADPASISTMASLTGQPGTAGDFAQAARLRHRHVINNRFAVQRYTIASYAIPETSGDGYGIVPLDHRGELSLPSDPLPTPLSTSSSTHSTDNSSWRSSMKRDEILDLAIATVAAMILFGLILTYYLNSASTAFEKFMDSQTFGPRFLLTILTLILKTPLLSLCARTTATIPFARLAKRPQAAKLDLLQPVPVTALGSIGYTLRRFEWYAAGLSITAGLVVELLLILIPGVPYQSHELLTTARTSWIGCLACLALILLVIIAGWIRLVVNKSLGVHGWPRLPVSVGAIAMYVADSSMAHDCAATDRASLQVQGARYQFARLDGRWVVDYAEHAAGAEQGLRHRGSAAAPEEVRLQPKGVDSPPGSLPSSLYEDPSIAYGITAYEDVVGRGADRPEPASPPRNLHSYSYDRSTRRGPGALEPAALPSAHGRRPSSLSMHEWRSYHSQTRSIASPDLVSLRDYIVHHGAE